jgi:hypothetical protein
VLALQHRGEELEHEAVFGKMPTTLSRRSSSALAYRTIRHLARRDPHLHQAAVTVRSGDHHLVEVVGGIG